MRRCRRRWRCDGPAAGVVKTTSALGSHCGRWHQAGCRGQRGWAAGAGCRLHSSGCGAGRGAALGGGRLVPRRWRPALDGEREVRFEAHLALADAPPSLRPAALRASLFLFSRPGVWRPSLSEALSPAPAARGARRPHSLCVPPGPPPASLYSPEGWRPPHPGPHLRVGRALSLLTAAVRCCTPCTLNRAARGARPERAAGIGPAPPSGRVSVGLSDRVGPWPCSALKRG